MHVSGRGVLDWCSVAFRSSLASACASLRLQRVRISVHIREFALLGRFKRMHRLRKR
ncbi:hypothetical protein M758_UG004500 [Ceratodon purpureus]|nr:hypothetical protein M758_UG004500 [Ceratodon purpureus]